MGLLCFACSLFFGYFFIKISKKINAGQPILKYVEEHKKKNGTPTMGGLFFIIPTVVIYLIFVGVKERVGVVALCICLAFMLVGFLDDFIKIKFKKNEGLKPYQKIIFQFGIALTAGFFCFFNGITTFNLPFVKLSIDLGEWTIFLVGIIFIAITNSVNLTDGIDGLAGSVSIVYLSFIAVIVYMQSDLVKQFYDYSYENDTLIKLSVCFIGAILGFLVYNYNKAKVFMGDTGSLAIGGLLGAISIFSGNSLLIPILGVTFVFSSVSVMMQVFFYKKTKKRIFLMAPFHHHLQMKGLSEGKISFFYSLLTVIIGVVLVISYL